MGGVRLTKYDYGVLGLFVLTIIGVSLSWYRITVDFFGGASANGWDYGLGVLAFLFALIAAIVVGLKLLLPADTPLPAWYREGLAIMVLGGLVALFALIRIVDRPMGFGDGIGYGPGVFVTFIAGLLLVGCGYLIHRDKSRLVARPARPPAAGPAGPAPGAYEGGQTPPASDTPQADPGARFCTACGKDLDPDAAFCRSCGKPV